MADAFQGTGHRRAAGRWGRAAAVVAGVGLAVTLVACTDGEPDTFTPKPIETITPSSPPKTTPTSPASSAKPSETPTTTPAKPAVKATGSLAFYMTVSKALTGTCGTVDGAPTLTLADHNNDFYGTVDLTVVLDAQKKSVASVAGALGEDSEGFTWKLSYSSSGTAKGTSAALKASGKTYTISGKLAASETRKGTTRNEVLPFKVVATCASADW